jgi:hypothetical protein
LFASREEVYELLGPPSSINSAWGPDLRRWAERAEHSNRHLGIPDGGFWDLWIDPRDGSKGIAILFAGGKVYHIAKKGF